MNFKQSEQQFIEEVASLYEQQEAKELFYLVILQLSGWSRAQLMVNQDVILSDTQQTAFVEIFNELKTGKPLQHIFAEAWFYGLKFKVSSAVLIPRPETEELVEWILTDQSILSPKILDIGTGSGCIAISIKKNKPTAEVSALDVSEEALAIAKTNASQNETVINFIHSDILSYITEEKYDLIVSNPPYITENEKKEMHQNVLQHEPHLALFVTNENPLIFYAAIADLASKQLKTNGLLYFEINEYLGKETVDMLNDKGFINIILKKDMQGKDRMIQAGL